MSHMVTERCLPGSRYDLSAVAFHMTQVLEKWLLAGWNIEMILFDGLTPESKFAETERRRSSRIKDAIGAQSLSLQALCADVCSDVILADFPDIGCKIAPAECDDVLASLVYNYAVSNPSKNTYVMTNDTDFCAFDFPDTVTILNTSVYGIDAGVINTFCPSKSLDEHYSIRPSLAAYGAMEFSKLNKSASLVATEGYQAFRASQMAILTKFDFSNAQQYSTNKVASRAYTLLGNSSENNAHRVVNCWLENHSRYLFLPIVCEPKESEYAFDAGRKWRSVAYELILEPIGGVETRNEHLDEHGRREDATCVVELPIGDVSRAQFDASGRETYKFDTREKILKDISEWDLEKMVQEIWSEALATTPQSNGEYHAETMEELGLDYLRQILRLRGGPRKNCTLKPAFLRFYNKFLAIFMSLRMLEAAGVKFPVQMKSYDLDGSLWWTLARRGER